LVTNRLAPRFSSLQQYVQSPVHTIRSGRQSTFAVTRFEVTIFDIPAETSASGFPPVLITSMYVNGKEQHISDNIELSAGENTITIDYTAVSFKNTGALRFQYKLEPLEEQWHSAATGRSVTYANVSPGTYNFRVRVVNQQGVPSDISSALPFSIASPIWFRWWFIVLVVFIAAVIIISVEQFRVRRLLEIEKIRSRIAADLHDDIGSGLTRIALLSEMIQRQTISHREPVEPEYSVPSLTEKVGAISRELVDAMTDVVWSIDPKNSSMKKLIQRVQTFAVEVCEAKEIDLSFTVDDAVEHLKVESDSIRAVLLVAKEALTNVVRHSKANKVTVSMHTEQLDLIVVIKDNGIGFDMNELTRMNGLTNMKIRVEKIGGNCSILSAKGSGSSVTASIPLH
jgi:two-component sensor histidine kinase